MRTSSLFPAAQLNIQISTSPIDHKYQVRRRRSHHDLAVDYYYTPLSPRMSSMDSEMKKDYEQLWQQEVRKNATLENEILRLRKAIETMVRA